MAARGRLCPFLFYHRPVETLALPMTTEAAGPTGGLLPSQENLSPERITGLPLIDTVIFPIGLTAFPPICGLGGDVGVSIGQRCLELALAAGRLLIKTLADPETITPP